MLTAKERYAAYLAKQKPAARDAEPETRDAEPAKSRLQETKERCLLVRLLCMHAQPCDCSYCSAIRDVLPAVQHTGFPAGMLTISDAGKLYGYSRQGMSKSTKVVPTVRQGKFLLVAVADMEAYVIAATRKKADVMRKNSS